MILAIAPTIGIGICRFAYALVLPDMRDSLGWSYSVAGIMNTINAAGYLVGALGANVAIRRFGMLQTIRVSTIVSVLTLVMSAVTGDLVMFGCVRLLSGVTGRSPWWREVPLQPALHRRNGSIRLSI